MINLGEKRYEIILLLYLVISGSDFEIFIINIRVVGCLYGIEFYECLCK